MSHEVDLLEQLGRREVPPVPSTLDEEVHQRVNQRLLLAHLTDFVLQAMPAAMLEFAKALEGLVRYSLTRWVDLDREGRPRRRKRR